MRSDHLLPYHLTAIGFDLYDVHTRCQFVGAYGFAGLPCQVFSPDSPN